MNNRVPIPAMKTGNKPKKANKKIRLLVFMFFIALMAVLFFRSSLSEISSIEIKGNHYVSEEELMAAVQVENGDSYFLVNEQEIENDIMELKEIRHAKVTKSFPGRMTVEVEEFPGVAYEVKSDGTIVLLLANGTQVSASSQQMELDKPLLTGWEGRDAEKVELSSTIGEIPSKLLADISEIKPLPSTTSYKDKILLYTRSGFEVITTISYLKDKIDLLPDIIYELRSQDITSGEISMLEAIIHRPFGAQEGTEVGPDTSNESNSEEG
ncbi:cell division protein FtsQ/DivIB [Marinicrinis lubricantis]|uniref:Cell division protein FtsQ/DivIB n=1 Tax=Marinicrinis lubricantis TaxID=2086470 RepID=A0ABW1ISB0_9BACL